MSDPDEMLSRVGFEYAEVLMAVEHALENCDDAAALVARMATAGYVWTKTDEL